MNKAKLVSAICEMLEEDRIRLKEAARATYEAATHEESKPENEYDTRGLEASYLAGAQAQRVADTEEILFTFRTLEKTLSDGRGLKSEKVISTSLVEVESDGRKSLVFLMPKGGGIALKFEGSAVQVVTPSSPLGGALIGLVVGDVATIEAGAQVREYDVLRVE
ncbi:MAG: GreA/GreB family elongation factor [Bdellovibrionia bacterium]